MAQSGVIEEDKEVKAYMEFKRLERSEQERLEAVTDKYIAEEVERIRNLTRERRDAFEAAKAKEEHMEREQRKEALRLENNEKTESVPDKLEELKKETAELEAKFYEQKVKEQDQIQSVIEHLPAEEQKKIWAQLEKTDNAEIEKDGIEKQEPGIIEKAYQTAKENEVWKANNHENVWDQFLKALAATVMNAAIEITLEIPAEKVREARERFEEAEKRQKELERREGREGRGFGD